MVFSKPLSVIFPNIDFFKKILRMRRELGISMFYFALAHGSSYILKDGVSPYTREVGYVAGIFALSIYFILYLTSNNVSVRKLKRRWKKLHYLVYPAYILTMLHVGLVGGETLLTQIIEFILNLIYTAIVEKNLLAYIVLAAFIIFKTIEWSINYKRKMKLQNKSNDL